MQENEWIKKFENFSEREKIIVLVGYVDDYLTKQLEARLIPLPGKSSWGDHRPFVGKLRLAYAVGVINENFFYEAKLLAKIRNVFAHNPSCDSCEHEDVKKHINEFLSIAPQYATYLKTLRRKKIKSGELQCTFEEIDKLSAAFIFNMAMEALFTYLNRVAAASELPPRITPVFVDEQI